MAVKASARARNDKGTKSAPLNRSSFKSEALVGSLATSLTSSALLSQDDSTDNSDSLIMVNQNGVPVQQARAAQTDDDDSLRMTGARG